MTKEQAEIVIKIYEEINEPATKEDFVTWGPGAFTWVMDVLKKYKKEAEQITDKFPARNLGNGEKCRTLVSDEAFKCPRCGSPMRREEGYSTVTACCTSCTRELNLRYWEPQVMDIWGPEGS